MFVLNSATISGRLGSDPESIADGKGCRFSVAVEDRFKSGDEWQSRTNWIPVTAWGSISEQIRKKLHKGSEVAIEGKLREETWEKDGQKRSKVGIVAFAFHTEYRDNGDGARYESDVPADTADMAGTGVNDGDDIPF